MDRDTIFRLAREAGLWEIFEQYSGEFSDGNPEVCLEELERFAALVVANNPPQSWMSYQEGYEAGQQAGRRAEREECAQVCDRYTDRNHWNMAGLCAEAIRSRT